MDSVKSAAWMVLRIILTPFILLYVLYHYLLGVYRNETMHIYFTDPDDTAEDVLDRLT